MEYSEVLARAFSAWNSAGCFRSRRERSKRFTYGDQWGDIVHDTRLGTMTEQELIEKSGKRAYTNNLIRQLVKTVVGRFRTQASESAAYGGDIGAIARANMLGELDARLLEEFLISGCAVQRIVCERRWGGKGVWVDNVNPRMFFVNPYNDPRGWDIDMIGMLHDMSLPELINRFAGGSEQRAGELRRIYDVAAREPLGIASSLGDESAAGDFFMAAGSGKCRVIEVWTFDSRRMAEGCADSDFCWHCRNFAPDGSLIAEYDSPYSHGLHPFAVKFYPLTDGEVHSFVEDVLDQQKFINRLVVTLDHIMSCSAKGVLLFPENQLSRNTSWKHVTEAWARADGVIPIKGTGMHLPQQVVTNGANSNAYQLLQLQMKLLEDVSGVSDALTGRGSTTARGADMLENQIRNATLALADLFETFTSFTEARNSKALATAA